MATTLILIVGVILSAAASGRDQNGMFWMLIIARGLVGVGAGGEYPGRQFDHHLNGVYPG